MAEKRELIGVGMLKAQLRAVIEDMIMTSPEMYLCFTGTRSVGKTYTVQKTVLKHCLSDRVEFIFVVDTRNTMDDGALNSWLKKVLKNEFKQYETKCTLSELYIRKKKTKDDWQCIGHCIPLSKAEGDKLNSYPDVRYIIMDEATINNKAYMSFYMERFLTIYQTADRDLDVVKAILIGNTLQKVNPIYSFFGATTQDLSKEGTVKRTYNRLFWFIPEPPDINEKEDGTEVKFRKMVEGTSYGDMMHSEFAANYGFLIQQPQNGVLTYTNYGVIFTNGVYMQVLDCNDGYTYVECVTKEHLEQYCSPIYCVDYRDVTEDRPRVQIWFRDILKLYLDKGTLKFIDEEALLVLSAHFKSAFNINITV